MHSSVMYNPQNVARQEFNKNAQNLPGDLLNCCTNANVTKCKKIKYKRYTDIIIVVIINTKSIYIYIYMRRLITKKT